MTIKATALPLDGSPATTAALVRELRRALTPASGIQAVLVHSRFPASIPREEEDDEDEDNVDDARDADVSDDVRVAAAPPRRA